MDLDYLFAERATIHDVVEHQRKKLQEHVHQMPADEIASQSVDTLVDSVTERFRLYVPLLDRAGTVQLASQEVDIDVSRDRLRMFMTPGPHYVKGTAVRIAIPYAGEGALFRYGTSPFNVPIQGQVVDNSVVLTHVAERPDPATVKKDFDERIGRIENMLQMVRGPADEWNRQLPALARIPLEQRRSKIDRDRGLDIGYPAAPPVPPDPKPSSSTTTPSRSPAKPRTVSRYDLFLSHAA